MYSYKPPESDVTGSHTARAGRGHLHGLGDGSPDGSLNGLGDGSLDRLLGRPLDRPLYHTGGVV